MQQRNLRQKHVYTTLKLQKNLTHPHNVNNYHKHKNQSQTYTHINKLVLGRIALKSCNMVSAYLWQECENTYTESLVEDTLPLK